MNTKKLAEAIGEIDVRYVEIAMNYQAKKKRYGWLMKFGVMAACLCFLVITGLNIGISLSGRGGCGNPLSHNVTLADGKMYYTSNDNVYLYDIDHSTQKKIADSDGVLTKTGSGLFLFDKESGNVYSVADSALTLIGDIRPDSITPETTLLDVLDGRIYYMTSQNDGMYSIVENDPAMGTTSEILSASNMAAQTILDHKLYYYTGETDGAICVFDMQTKENTTIYNAEIANRTEINDVIFYDDFILFETDHGLFSMGYNDEKTTFLGEYYPVTGALDYFNQNLYFIKGTPDNGEELISLNVLTGEVRTVTKLTGENGTTQTYTEIVVCDTGYFYTDPSASEGGLFYHRFDDQSEIVICKSFSN